VKKDLLTHFTFLIAFFIFISLFKSWLALSFLPFWIGGILGTLLPDLDHLIYVYLLKPHELTSQRVNSLIASRNIVKTWNLLASTRSERTELIFHTVSFQLIFLIFAFLVVTSSGSLLGRGLVLAFSLHILIDQAIDLIETDNLDNWFRKLPVSLNTRQRHWYLAVTLVTLLILGFVL
jgi:hypothetical protein